MLATETPTITETLPRKKFTRGEVRQMMDAGLFAGQRFELIAGDLIDKMGQKPLHAFGILAFQSLLASIVSLGRIRIQLPFEIEGEERERSEPEPDLAVVASDVDAAMFKVRHPKGNELALAVEVSDTTLRGDLTIKRDLYARAEVSEYWVLDLNARQLIVHWNPVGGVYLESFVRSEDESVAFEGAQIPVSKMLV
jgi:Uma2 family endonuclease